MKMLICGFERGSGANEELFEIDRSWPTRTRARARTWAELASARQGQAWRCGRASVEKALDVMSAVSKVRIAFCLSCIFLPDH